MKTRAVQQRDLDSWANFRLQLWPDSGDGYRAELVAYFAGDCSVVTQAFVLENDQAQLCGFIELNIRSNITGSTAPKMPFIEGWFVAGEYRACGFGAKLMARAEQWAQDQGYTEPGSDAEANNTPSIKAHLGFGFQETQRIVCFIKQLE